MKEAANLCALPSRRGRLNIRCQGLRVRRRAWFVHLQFKIGRFVQKSGNLWVRCCFSQPKQDRRLPHEILFSDHVRCPRGIPAPTPLRSSLEIIVNHFTNRSSLTGVGTSSTKSDLVAALWLCLPNLPWASKLSGDRASLRGRDPRLMMMFVKKWRDHLGNAVTERSLALQTGYHPRHSSS